MISPLSMSTLTARFMPVAACTLRGRSFGTGLLSGDCRIKVFGGAMLSAAVDCWYEVMMTLTLAGITRHRHNADPMIRIRASLKCSVLTASRPAGVGSLTTEMIPEMRSGMRRTAPDETKMAPCMTSSSWVRFWSASSPPIMRRTPATRLTHRSVVAARAWCGVVLFRPPARGPVSGMAAILMATVSARSVMANGAIDTGGLMGCVSR